MSNGLCSALVVANAFIRFANAEKQRLQHEDIQYLTFMAHGISLAERAMPLVKEDIMVLQGEPVIPELFDALCEQQSNTVQLIDNVKSINDFELTVLLDNFLMIVWLELKDHLYQPMREFPVLNSNDPDWENMMTSSKETVTMMPNALIERRFLQHLGYEKKHVMKP